jgi:hypothetical protein
MVLGSGFRKVIPVRELRSTIHYLTFNWKAPFEPGLGT